MGLTHIPVLLDAVTDNLVGEGTKLFVDATIGGAGHSCHLLERFENLRLVGIDADEEALEIARGKLQPFANRVTLIRGNFRDLKDLLEAAGVSFFDGILFDLGLSTYQITGKRGFSFDDDCALDMRIDDRESLTAMNVVNEYSYASLIRILEEFGQEEKARKIAKMIVEERKRRPIRVAKDLAHLVSKVKRRSGRINPATKTFQAIRMEVNRELENIRTVLGDAIGMLNQKGRIGVISFHSLEDRIVKETFRGTSSLKIITKKPIRPVLMEIRANPASRSAKLRIGEKC
jgi:16S rRNA (cytosine1402-N4)-methyltransferase